MEEEIWRPLRQCLTYEVSNLGRIRRIIYAAYGPNKSGYPRANLFVNGRRTTVLVHRAMAEAFIPNPQNLPEVNHKDGDRTNFALDNLEWVTRSENLRHAMALGLTVRHRGEDHWKARLTTKQVKEIRELAGSVSQSELAQRFAVSKTAIKHILQKRSWKLADAGERS